MQITSVIKFVCTIFILPFNLQACSEFWDAPNAVTGHVYSSIMIHFYSPQQQHYDKQLQPSFDRFELFQLAQECQRKLVFQMAEKKGEILNLMDGQNITKKMLDILKDELSVIKKYNVGVGYSQNAIIKLSLLSSRTLPWATTMRYLFEMYPNGLFQNYTFEDAIFIICLSPKQPMLLKYWDKYKDDVSSYTNWLVGSMQKILKEIYKFDLKYKSGEYKQSLAENALRQVFVHLYPALTTITTTHQ